MNNDHAALHQYISLYEQAGTMLCQHSAPLMNALRDRALSALKTHGLPTRKTEAYRYTDVAAMLEPDYGLNLQRLDLQVDPRQVYKCEVPGMKSQLHYMVNDRLREEREERKEEDHAGSTDGIRVVSLREEALHNPQRLAQYYGKLARVDDDSLMICEKSDYRRKSRTIISSWNTLLRSTRNFLRGKNHGKSRHLFVGNCC